MPSQSRQSLHYSATRGDVSGYLRAARGMRAVKRRRGNLSRIWRLAGMALARALARLQNPLALALLRAAPHIRRARSRGQPPLPASALALPRTRAAHALTSSHAVAHFRLARRGNNHSAHHAAGCVFARRYAGSWRRRASRWRGAYASSNIFFGVDNAGVTAARSRWHGVCWILLSRNFLWQPHRLPRMHAAGTLPHRACNKHLSAPSSTHCCRNTTARGSDAPRARTAPRSPRAHLLAYLPARARLPCTARLTFSRGTCAVFRHWRLAPAPLHAQPRACLAP